MIQHCKDLNSAKFRCSYVALTLMICWMHIGRCRRTCEPHFCPLSSDNTPQHDGGSLHLPTPFGRGRGSLKDSFWHTGWLLNFLATGDQTQGRFALIDALTRKGNCPPRHIRRNVDFWRLHSREPSPHMSGRFDPSSYS